MSKKIFPLAIALTLYTFSSPFAATQHLSEYDWDDPSAAIHRKTGSLDILSSDETLKDNDYCTDKCRGYSTTITICDAGFELKTCSDYNCFEYHKCEATGCAPGYDTELKDCIIDVQEDNYLCSKCIE